MRKRRVANGEGCIYQRPDGRWVGSLSVRQPGGARKRKVVYGRTQKEVQEKITSLRADQQNGLPIPIGRTTGEAFLTRWLETMDGTVRPTTFRRYSECVRLHVIPAIGSMALQQIGPSDLQALYADKRKRLSPRSVLHIHRIVHEALGQAARWNLVPRNVADLVKAPRVERVEMKVWSREEARLFLRETAADRVAALYALALATGMRQGELLGLRWTAVDLDRDRVSVQKTLYRAVGGQYQLLEPKTASSRRSIDIDPAVVLALRQRRKDQMEERLRAGTTWCNDMDLVFTSALGEPLDGTYVTQAFQEKAKKLGLPPIRFHDLRHTCATILLQDGVHPKVVQEMLGHSTIAITLDTYSHVVAGMHHEASRAMGKALFG